MGNSIVTERGPKVRVIASPSTWLEGEALRQLDEVAKLPGMRLCVGMPDLHPGKGSPVGAAFLSEGTLHPALVGTDIGCGMSFWATDMAVKKAKSDRIAEHMDGLDSAWDGDAAAWLAERGVAETAYDASLGTPGFGNHFCEVQIPHEVVDETAFAALGLDGTRLCLLVHTGSRGFGESILRDIAARHGASPLADGDAAAVGYMAAHDHAVAWAAANRDLCAHRVLEAIGAQAHRVLDVCHNSVTEAVADGCKCWLHRKGAAPSDRGPVVIPGSRGDLSFLVRPVADALGALSSVAHGAGRKLARHEAKAKLRGRYRREDLSRNPFGGTVVCGNELLLWEEAPECYKPIADIVGDLVGAGLIEIIASFRPLVTFKTSEGARDEIRARKDWQQDRKADRQAKRGREWR